MADRRVKVVFSAEIQNYKSAMEAAAAATEKTKKAAEQAGKAAEQAGKQSEGAAKRSAEEIAKLAAAHQDAAKAAGFQYSAMGQLVDVNGKTLSSQQAAAHGLQTFSEEAYLAGQAAAVAGEAQEKAAREVSAASEEAAKVASEAAKEHEDALQSVGEAAIIGGGAVVAGVGLAVKAYADFDKQMSSVDAATHETAGNMALLRQAAMDAGRDTSFSAGEAAQGIEEMSKAGVKTADILGGGLKGTLALAAAGALGVGEASEIASSAMTQFGLSGKDIPHIADLLAAGAGKAQGSVQDLGLALSYAGVPAAGLGISIEQTTGTLALFAKAGITGDKAGTALRAMLVSMVKPADTTKKAMDDLGITFSDSKGKFIGLDGAASVLQDKLGGLDDMTRNATLAQIFGNEALGAAQTLYNGGADGVQKMTAAVDDYGYATDTATRMQNNLSGDLEKLGGSFDTVLIQSGSGANDVLRGMVQGLGGVVDAVGKVPTPVLVATTGVAALTGGVVLFGGVLTTVMPKIAAVKAQLALIGPVGTRAGAAMSRAGAFAAGAASAFVAIAAASILAKPALEQILKPTGETGDALEAFGGQAALGAVGADTLNKSFQDLVEHKDGVGDFQKAIEGIADPGIWGNIDNILVGGIKIFTLGMADVSSTSDKARERMKALGEQLASVDAGKAAKSFQDMAKATDGSDGQLKQLIDLMPAYRKTLEDQAKATGHATDDQTLLDIAMGKIPVSTDKAAGSIKAAGEVSEKAAAQSEEIAKQLGELGLNADGTVASLDKFTTALVNAGLLTLSSRDATAKFDEALDGLKTQTDEIMATEQAHGGVLNEGKTDLDLYSEAGRAANDVLADMTQKGIGAAEAMAKNGDSMPAIQEQLGKTYDAMVTTAEGFGLGKEEAEALTRGILHIPPGVDINTWMSDEAKRMAEATKKAAEDIPKDVKINITIDTFKTTFEKLVGLPAQISDGSAGQGLGVYAPGFVPVKATGGILRGYSDGGQLPSTGPGTGVTDGFLGVDALGVPVARLDKDEWIINGHSSNRYNRELAAINAGTFPKLPGYANGRAGREYSAQSMGYAGPAAAAPPVNLTQHINGTTAPREVADEAMGMIRWELQKQGVRLGG